jgi:asparagine synthetase B (glutamine-hydrolysing)
MMMGIMGLTSDSRGGRGWGYWTPNQGIVKGLGDILPNIPKAVHETTFLGHTRWPTVSAQKAENSHPYDVGNIILAHNGIIYNADALNTKYNRNCQVDSEHLAHHLNEGLPFDDLYGYGAIWFIRKDQPNRIFICKLYSGDLSVHGVGTGHKNCNGVIFSSDEKHMEAALGVLGNIKTFEYQIQTGQVYYIEAGKLWVSDEPKLTLGTHSGPSRDWREGVTEFSKITEISDDPSEQEILQLLKESGIDDESVEEMEMDDIVQQWHEEEAIRQRILSEGMSRRRFVNDGNTTFEERYDRLNGTWVKLG